MAAFRIFINRLLFAAYVLAFVSIPFTMLLGWPGAMGGALGATVFLVALRYHGTQRIAKQLAVKLLPPAESPHWNGMVREYCRRLGMGSPRLGVIETESVNIASFGFSAAQGWIVLTRGALNRMSRAELSALIAWHLVLWKRGEVSGHTWLALFIQSLDIWVEPKRDRTRARIRESQPVRLFLRQVLFYPLTLIPCAVLRGHVPEKSLDAEAAKLCGSQRALSEGLRKIEAYSERQPLRVPVSYQHLFLKGPNTADPLARLFFSTSTLADRIRFLEQLPVLENA